MFSENYSVCLNDDGSPREIGHDGPVATYKAMGYDSGRMVAMQLIPQASLTEGDRVRLESSAESARLFDHPNIARVFDIGAKDGHLVFVSEYLDGESAEDWIDEHGPMPTDAALRIAYQIANAMAAAQELGVAPHSIQPANIIIVPGAAADGGWPAIKIRNFGLPAVKVNAENGEARELLPSMPPQFASPEQRANTTLDFRSDIFSLGATLWFLLTGSAPPLTEAKESAPRLSAPNVPRFVRNLVSSMLHTDPAERPQELAALAARFRVALQKAERKTAFTRSFAPAALPGTMKPQRKSVAPALALAAAVIILAALAAFVLPQRFANAKRKPLGVVIGVPETTPQASPIYESSAPSAAVSEQAVQSPVIAQQSLPPATAPSNSGGAGSGFDEAHTPSPPNGSASSDADKLSSSTQLAENKRVAEPPIAAEGPVETTERVAAPDPASSIEKSEPPRGDVPDGAATADSSSTVAEKSEPPNPSENAEKRDDSRPSKRKLRHQRFATSSIRRPLPPLVVGSESARLVGTTAAGNWILRSRSGHTFVTPRVPSLEDAPVVTPRHIRRVERPFSVGDEEPVAVLPPD